jgi:hypothetical protein
MKAAIAKIPPAYTRITYYEQMLPAAKILITMYRERWLVCWLFFQQSVGLRSLAQRHINIFPRVYVEFLQPRSRAREITVTSRKKVSQGPGISSRLPLLFDEKQLI